MTTKATDGFSTFKPGKKDKVRKHLMTMEKALDFDQKIQDMDKERQKLLTEVEGMKAILSRQEIMMREYEELMFKKNLMRKEVSSEIELLRREKFAARDELTRVRMRRHDIDAAKRKMALENRHRHIIETKKEYMTMLENYMNYRGNFSFDFFRKFLCSEID